MSAQFFLRISITLHLETLYFRRLVMRGNRDVVITKSNDLFQKYKHDAKFIKSLHLQVVTSEFKLRRKPKYKKKTHSTNSTQPVLLTFEENRGQCK